MQPSCQISLFYIKPQLAPVFDNLFYVVKYLFSTSNHNFAVDRLARRMVVKYLFSTSNHNLMQESKDGGKVVKYLFSTSNHNSLVAMVETSYVVKYLFSTSNHNGAGVATGSPQVVKYLFSTSNHNQGNATLCYSELSNISFLHQTTTERSNHRNQRSCQISLFYIKPQHNQGEMYGNIGCQISLFYIKPQLE